MVWLLPLKYLPILHMEVNSKICQILFSYVFKCIIHKRSLFPQENIFKSDIVILQGKFILFLIVNHVALTWRENASVEDLWNIDKKQ